LISTLDPVINNGEYSSYILLNIDRLKQLNIPAPEVLNLFYVTSTWLSALRYSPLPRQTIKDIMKAGLINEALVYQDGAFVAKIQALGVYLRGLYIGNMALTPNGELGLIDVSEFSIYWHLSSYRRLINFARFWRSKQYKYAFGEKNISALIEGYLSVANFYAVTCQSIAKRLI
jgi:hypothetical protein